MQPEVAWFDDLPTDRLLAEFSLWSADLANLAYEVERVNEFVDLYHLDVSDGHFSPTLLFFPDQVASLRKLTAKPFHVHLMVTDDVLLEQIDQFAEAGANVISVHAENSNWKVAIKHIKSLGLKTGIVVQLHTPISSLHPMLVNIDFLTLLGTQIGVKGQSLSQEAPTRLRQARKVIEEVVGDRRMLLASDGAIREHTVPLLRDAGAETIVMGSLAFNEVNLAKRIAWVHEQTSKT